MLMQSVYLEDLLAADHPARTIWEISGRLDLSAFESPIEARGSSPGRPATDPRLLFSLWLFAYTNGVGNGRELARLCEAHDAYRWLCGGVHVNYHTLNDFRVNHEAALDKLFTDVLATLMHHKVVEVTRISQDGTRVRASSGSSSFRRRKTLEERKEEAEAHVKALKEQGQEQPALSKRQKASRERAAREKVKRLDKALEELQKMEQAKANQRDSTASKKNPPGRL
jgi:transposase